MLIDFRVKNYRSIRDEQLISFVAAKDDTHAKTHLIETGDKATPHILKTAVIYGANASGKTNLIRAFEFLRAVVIESAGLQLGQKFNLQPFKLDSSKIDEPSEFEITFLSEGIRYQYGFALTAERITGEWLLVYNKPKPQEWFTREYDPKTNQDNYKFGSHLKGQRKIWQEATRQNALFLSTAVQLNSEQLRSVFLWIKENVNVFGAGVTPLPDYSMSMLQKEAEKGSIISFLSSADISIKDIDVVSRKGILNQVKVGADGKAEFRAEQKDILSPVFKHETGNGSASFEIEDESQGTQRLFHLAAPILEILRDGKILIVDELDSSLHTILVRKLISLFHCAEKNKKGAQLIFTTHDTTLLDTDLFRRDQVWFVEKDSSQATTIYPLTDFSPRKKESLEKGYLMGRYGALPFFSDIENFV